MTHDDVMKWKHLTRYWPFVQGIHRSPVNSLHKGQWRGALMFSLICTRINGWVNNAEACDLRRHRAHYDVTVWDRVLLHIHKCAQRASSLWDYQTACNKWPIYKWWNMKCILGNIIVLPSQPGQHITLLWDFVAIMTTWDDRYNSCSYIPYWYV